MRRDDRTTAAQAALLLLGSGFCALVYQVSWLRLLRLIFGSSTLASSAVLAIFMGGLGLGGLLLGRRVDRHPTPLALYARLELGVALSAALSPLLIAGVRALYLGLGGAAALGSVGGTAVRLGLAALVLGVPTFLMGGTLPAVVRAVERQQDAGRRALGLLYAANTTGAVLGALVPSFLTFERLGVQQTILAAALVNLLVALVAGALARQTPAPAPAAAPSPASVTPADATAPAALVLGAAALVGFVFMLMELVWYRMLAPLLGGSSYTFALILAVALAGIGLGGLLYGLGAQRRRPTLTDFALSCAAEALLLALPLALGDGLAVLAIYVRPLGDGLGFPALVGAWTVITAAVVLPPALVAGYQFPLLVGLLGAGGEGVGRQVGQAYAWNTAGSIVGAIAGGFGLLPAFGAVGLWRAGALGLAGLALASVGAAAVRDRAAVGGARAGVPLGLALAAILLCQAPGPSAAWRHSPIGVGRVKADFSDRAALESWLRTRRRSVAWEADGVESSIGVSHASGAAFIVTGKIDGNAREDAPTQVMAGLVGTALHPAPRSAMVIGLGTGSTAGWMAEVPTLERVHAVELEPALLRFAAECAPVNQDVLHHPRVTLTIGDAREVIQADPARYDVIFSEPSNPYRAGIASLFSQEFYAAVAGRLTEDGLLVQWLQGYEVDAASVRTVYATLGAVFPYVETWQVHQADLLLVASMHPLDHDAARIAGVVSAEPYATALRTTWGVSGLAGLYTGYVGGPALAAHLTGLSGGALNTDDRSLLEFGFARAMGTAQRFSAAELRALSVALDAHRPPWADAAALEDLLEQQGARSLAFGWAPWARPGETAERAQRDAARSAWVEGDLEGAAQRWAQQPEAPEAWADLRMLAEARAQLGAEDVPTLAVQLRVHAPVEADAVLARWHAVRGEPAEAAALLVRALEGYRTDPWPSPLLMEHTLELAQQLGTHAPAQRAALLGALSEPFAVWALDSARQRVYLRLALAEDPAGLCEAAFAPLEPWPPWEEELLAHRAACYTVHGHPRAAEAAADLERYRQQRGESLTP